MEKAHGNGDTDHIVGKGPEEVLLDIADGGAGKLNGGSHIRQSVAHEDDVSRLDGHICTISDGHPDMGLGQGWGIVDAISDHGHMPACFLEFF